MRVLTHLARPGLKLAAPVASPDGMPWLGRGTVLNARLLKALEADGVGVIEVEPGPDGEPVPPWLLAPEVEAWCEALDRRFERVEGDRRMQALKGSIKRVMVPWLTDLEGA